MPQLFGGSWWIRTTEALSSRFTVCPHWPLGKAPIFICATALTALDYYSRIRWKKQALFQKYFCKRRNGKRTAAVASALQPEKNNTTPKETARDTGRSPPRVFSACKFCTVVFFMPAFDRILQLARMEEMGCEFVEVTAHEGARPTHAVWQGRVYHRGGAVVHDGERYEDFETATGYGTGPGLCGWNCRHNFYPFYPGVSGCSPPYARTGARLSGKDSCPQAGAHHKCAAAKPQAWAGYGTLIFGGYHLNKKKKSNKSGYPDEAIKTLARCFYPSMVEFFNSEEGQREYEEWLKEQEALQALPVAA